MSNAIKADGLVLGFDDGFHVYPMACAKTSTFTITQDFIELAPKTSSEWREYITARKTFVVSGDGLLKLDDTYAYGDDYLDDKIVTGSNEITGFLFMADSTDGKLYKFTGYMNELSYSASVGGFAQYSYSIQGTSEPTLALDTAQTVTAGAVTGVNPATYRYLALAIDGQLYFNYTPNPSTGAITVGTQFNGKTAIIFYENN